MSKATFALDLRSIALYRMSVSSIMLYCLLIRWTDLEAMYSDVGTMPRQTMLKHGGSNWDISIHMISGHTSVIALLFVVHLISLFMMFLGFYTTTAAVVAWMLELSIQNRNGLVLQGGDVVCRLLHMYALFLPLSACWSIDELIKRKLEKVEDLDAEKEEDDGMDTKKKKTSKENTTNNTNDSCMLRLSQFFTETNPRVYVGRDHPNNSNKTTEEKQEEEEEENIISSILPVTYQNGRGTVVYHIGTIAIVLQIIYLYTFAGILKSPDASWSKTYDALELALHTDEFTTPIGYFLRDGVFGQYGGLKYLTITSHWIELLCPLLVLPPYHLLDGGVSRFLVVVIYWCFHFGIRATMDIGHFSIVSCVLWTGKYSNYYIFVLLFFLLIFLMLILIIVKTKY